MSYESPGAGASAGPTCRYGLSRLMVRGPQRALDRPYIAFLGGDETFGRFVENPFPALVEDALNVCCVNLGAINAGVEAFVHDVELMRIAKAADMVVIQLAGADAMSNRFYRVHPRRNDRFVAASSMLRAIYPEVDFTEFSFNRHMLGALRDRSPERFEVVRAELSQAWVARMRLKLRMIGGPCILLWLRYRRGDDELFGAEPMFVTEDMVAALGDDAQACVKVQVQAAGPGGEIGDMIASASAGPAAAHLPGPRAHREIASRLAGELKGRQ